LAKFDVNKDWENFKNDKLAVNCPTEELAKEFVLYCKDNGVAWQDEEPNDETEWNDYKTNTCYECEDNQLVYSDSKWAKFSKYQIVEFTGFDIEPVSKPQLGLTPKKVHILLRCQDICRALNDQIQYEKADYGLMFDWIDELRDNLNELQNM
jgi:hypothetical protein